MQNLKKHKKTLSVNTPVLTAIIKMSVSFCIVYFERCFLTGSQNAKNNKTPKQQNKKTATRKQDANEKYILNKTTSRKTKKN